MRSVLQNMKTECQTIAAPCDSMNSQESDENFMKHLERTIERYEIRKFGRIGYEAYLKWILENQLPLS
jgi:hypothetical protein